MTRQPLTINGRTIGDHHPTYIIAEVGINHNGKLDLALRMVEEAARAGVDAVKVQIISADKSYAKDSPSYAIFKRVELLPDDWKRVVTRATSLKVDLFATFTQPEDMQTVHALGFPAIKISSSNVTNVPLLRAAARAQKPIILSTGLSYLSEVDEAVRYLEQEGCRQMAVLHCTSLYPTSPNDVNLRAIRTLRRTCPYTVGFSDHTMGNHCAMAAVALGARVLEKHLTLDRAMEGPDHHFSATPQELSELVRSVRETERALGTGIKCPALAELSERRALQRVLVVTEDVREGERFSEKNVAAKRSAQPGLAPKWYEMVLGRTCRRSVTRDTPVTMDIV